MANVDRPNGFRPVGTLSGSPWQGSVRLCSADADLFRGDIVTLGATGAVVGATGGGYMDADRATSTTATIALGVVVGWSPDPNNLAALYYDASSQGANGGVYVCTAPDVILEAQGDGDGTVAVVADIGENFDLVLGAGSTTTGVSNMEVDSSSGVTTADTPLKLIGFVDAPDNEVGVANQKMLVTLNMHVFGTGVGNVGV